MLTTAFILALTLGVPRGPEDPAPPAPDRANTWLRAWLAPLEAEGHRLVAGLDRETAATISAAIDARIEGDDFKASIRRAAGVIAEHSAEILENWASYQDESLRARELVARHFPAARDRVAQAMALMRSCDRALLGAESEMGLLTRAAAAMAEGIDLSTALDDPTLPRTLRAAFREGLRAGVAATWLVDMSKREEAVDAELVETLAEIWRHGANAYANVFVSLISVQHPGFASRWGLESHVDADLIDAFVAARGEPEDPVLGAFADDPGFVDEIVEHAMQDRERSGTRRGDA